MKRENVLKAILIILLLLLIDQGIKLFVQNTKTNMELIHGVISINYVENKGSAFGIGSNSLITIIVSNIIVLGIVIKFLVNQFNRIDKITKFMLYIVLAGGFSNLVDRIIRGYVIDYIDIRQLVIFPVFNIADVYIVIGWIMLVILTIKNVFRKEQIGEKANNHIGSTNR